MNLDTALNYCTALRYHRGMAITIDPREQITWQRQAIAVLDTLLAQSLKTGLPRLGWDIGSAGCSLVGRSTVHPSTDRRAVIQAWADSLGLKVQEHKHQSGMITLTAHEEQRKFGKLWATIALTADIFPDDDEDQDQPVSQP
jgi:hypothetical protein